MKRAVFLDRDGTINVEKDYLYKAEDFEYLDGAVEGLRFLQEKGYLLVIVTNQSGIARGYYSEEDFLELTQWMTRDLASRRVCINGVYYCPHYRKGIVQKYAVDCDCRKPKTKLYYDAARRLDIGFEDSIAIGDKMRDLSICRETGMKGILLSDKGSSGSNITVCASWWEIIHEIRKWG